MRSGWCRRDGGRGRDDIRIETALALDHGAREPKWSEVIAVGRRSFAEDVQRSLGAQARYRRIAEEDGASVLRDAGATYGIISLAKWAA